jgi:hypothetical protein
VPPRCSEHFALARNLRDATGGFHRHDVGFVRPSAARCGAEDHHGVTQRGASHAGDVGEDFAAHPLFAGVGDADHVVDGFAVRDVIAGFPQAGLQVGGRGGLRARRIAGQAPAQAQAFWAAGSAAARAAPPALSVAARQHLAPKRRRIPRRKRARE